MHITALLRRLLERSAILVANHAREKPSVAAGLPYDLCQPQCPVQAREYPAGESPGHLIRQRDGHRVLSPSARIFEMNDSTIFLFGAVMYLVGLGAMLFNEEFARLGERLRRRG